MAPSAATDSTERSMWPAMMTMARPIGHDADEGRLLDDVGEDADLEEVRHEEREDRQHHQQHEPDEIVEDEFGDGLLAGSAVMAGPVIERGLRRCRRKLASVWPPAGERAPATPAAALQVCLTRPA